MIIENLERQVDRLRKTVEEREKVLNQKRPKADFYINMQRRILSDPEYVLAWECFITLMKLTLDRSIKGLTELS